MDKEYLMLRTEMEDALKKQDQVFGIILSILGLTSAISSINENILFLFLILFLSTLLQLKVLEYRNIVYYISTYMVVFLEKDVEFNWETRLRKFKKEGYGYKNGRLKSKIINTIVFKFGKVIKHFIILGLVAFVVLKITINIYVCSFALWIKIILYILAVVFMIFNTLYAYTLSTDNVNYDSYINRWKRLKKIEQNNKR
ncbi:MAG: hypothetical protein ACI4U0_05915 [Candidatus Aphodocola sp.]